MFLISNC